MRSDLARRSFLGGMAAGVLGLAAESGRSAEQAGREVRLERMRPAEIEAAAKACGTLFLPLGTLEWHGFHNTVGVDAVKAHDLCVRAAQRGGGVVAPALFGGVGGLNEPWTFVMEPEDDIRSVLLKGWVEKLCREAVRNGFKAVIVLTGHYGAAQQIVVRDVAVRMTQELGLPVLGTPEYMLALDEGYRGDHAAWGETALMMYLEPGSVDLSRLGNPPHKGVFGRDPREATIEDGKRVAETIIGRLAKLAGRMWKWDAATVHRFAGAEAALVGRQKELAETEKVVWAGWRNVGKGVFDGYGRLLAEECFEEIERLVKAL